MANSDSGASGLTTLGFGFLVGAVVGIAVGMLYAPRPGVETREMVAEKAEEAKEKIGEAVEVVKKRAADMRNRPEAA